MRFNTEGLILSSMNRRWLAIIPALAAILFLSINVQADDSDPALISINVENGAYTNDTIIFSGIIEDDFKPAQSFWRVTKEGTTCGGGELYHNLEEIHSTSSRTQWTWSFSLSIAETGECACYVSIHTIDENSNEVIAQRVIFMVSENTSGLIGFMLYEDLSGNFIDSTVNVKGWVGSYPEASVTIQIITSITQGLIEAELFPQPTICSPPSFTSDTEIFTNGEFEFEFDISSKLDGWLKIDLISCSSSLSFLEGSIQEFSIRVNNEPPTIKISGIDFAIEDDTWHTFDASLTEDPYWGRTNMYYVWTLYRTSHSGFTPIDVKMGVDITSYSISGTKSGNYSLSLTVYDEGGQYSEKMVNFDISNTVPIISLEIDGELVSNNQEIKLTNPLDTLLDATGSTDSVNDKPGLRCVWLLDNVPLYEGCNRSFSWDEYQGEDYRAELTLEVIDDDGEYSILNVILIHPNEVQPIPIILVIPAICLIFLIYATINRFKSNNELEIPKWKS